MSAPAKVVLRRPHQPKFPDHCVVCGQYIPGNSALIFSWLIGWSTWLTMIPAGIITVRVPACWFCGWRLQISRWMHGTFVIAAALVTVWYIWPHVGKMVPANLHWWAQGGLALILLLPKFVYDAFVPPAFDVMAETNRVTYEFKIRSLGRYFAATNGESLEFDAALFSDDPTD